MKKTVLFLVFVIMCAQTVTLAHNPFKDSDEMSGDVTILYRAPEYNIPNFSIDEEMAVLDTVTLKCPNCGEQNFVSSLTYPIMVCLCRICKTVWTVDLSK